MQGLVSPWQQQSDQEPWEGGGGGDGDGERGDGGGDGVDVLVGGGPLVTDRHAGYRLENTVTFSCVS